MLSPVGKVELLLAAAPQLRVGRSNPSSWTVHPAILLGRRRGNEWSYAVRTIRPTFFDVRPPLAPPPPLPHRPFICAAAKFICRCRTLLFLSDRDEFAVTAISQRLCHTGAKPCRSVIGVAKRRLFVMRMNGDVSNPQRYLSVENGVAGAEPCVRRAKNRRAMACQAMLRGARREIVGCRHCAEQRFVCVAGCVSSLRRRCANAAEVFRTLCGNAQRPNLERCDAPLFTRSSDSRTPRNLPRDYFLNPYLRLYMRGNLSFIFGSKLAGRAARS